MTEPTQTSEPASAKRSYVKLDRLAEALAWAHMLTEMDRAAGVTPRKRTRGRGGEAVLATDTPALQVASPRNFSNSLSGL